MPYYFKSKKDIVALECPAEKSFIEAWHETEPGFGIRIMRARKRDSAVLRVYLARYTNEHGKKEKKNLEPFNQMAFDEASNRVRFLRGSAKTERQTGVKPVPTLREVFEQYLAEKDDSLSPTSVKDYKTKFKHLMQYEDSAQFLFGLIKRARKYYLGVTTITQDIDDFINSPYGKPIISNTSLQLLLKQSASSVDNLAKLFYLTEGEKYLLLNSGVGQGVLFAGNTHVAIQVVASANEHTIITTKPEEVMKKRQAAKEKAAEEATASGGD